MGFPWEDRTRTHLPHGGGDGHRGSDQTAVFLEADNTPRGVVGLTDGMGPGRSPRTTHRRHIQRQCGQHTDDECADHNQGAQGEGRLDTDRTLLIARPLMHGGSRSRRGAQGIDDDLLEGAADRAAVDHGVEQDGQGCGREGAQGVFHRGQSLLTAQGHKGPLDGVDGGGRCGGYGILLHGLLL
ncbi:hypothetical protein [Corynebacterium efficiens YS-314]|uniref:Uncharacterized protein n=1 Tax=Corynebacterium efficiens (strain DSM 44549 / YS-314 / AJ 12310 / JCM 11189 / NBRC 100395) TaxID=196164 RepID=Q8FST1_COREF|nr:hypothetical protein [Corynebacterium efficiens YS-314]